VVVVHRILMDPLVYLMISLVPVEVEALIMVQGLVVPEVLVVEHMDIQPGLDPTQ
jgi:hypothetical protein